MITRESSTKIKYLRPMTSSAHRDGIRDGSHDPLKEDKPLGIVRDERVSPNPSEKASSANSANNFDVLAPDTDVDMNASHTSSSDADSTTASTLARETHATVESKTPTDSLSSS